MNHSTKWRVVNTLLMNIPIAAAIAVAAQFLAIHTFILPLFCINFAMAYVLSFVVESHLFHQPHHGQHRAANGHLQ